MNRLPDAMLSIGFKLKPPKDDEFGSRGAEADYLSKLRRLLRKMEPGDQKLLLHMAQKVARD